MEKIINLVTEKAGISKDQAEKAVETVVTYLKDKMPGGLGSQVEGFLKGRSSVEGATAGLGDKVGGMFK